MSRHLSDIPRRHAEGSVVDLATVAALPDLWEAARQIESRPYSGGDLVTSFRTRIRQDAERLPGHMLALPCGCGMRRIGLNSHSDGGGFSQVSSMCLPTPLPDGDLGTSRPLASRVGGRAYRPKNGCFGSRSGAPSRGCARTALSRRGGPLDCRGRPPDRSSTGHRQGLPLRSVLR